MLDYQTNLWVSPIFFLACKVNTAWHCVSRIISLISNDYVFVFFLIVTKRVTYSSIHESRDRKGMKLEGTHTFSHSKCEDISINY